MVYDGAYQFAFTLIWQKPYVYLTRFHTWLLWYPLVWLSQLFPPSVVLRITLLKSPPTTVPVLKSVK